MKTGIKAKSFRKLRFFFSNKSNNPKSHESLTLLNYSLKDKNISPNIKSLPLQIVLFFPILKASVSSIFNLPHGETVENVQTNILSCCHAINIVKEKVLLTILGSQLSYFSSRLAMQDSRHLHCRRYHLFFSFSNESAFKEGPARSSALGE